MGEARAGGDRAMVLRLSTVRLECAIFVVVCTERDNLIDRAAELGDRMLTKLQTELAGSNRIKQIRGLGLMLAVELNEDAPNLVVDAMAQGVLINVTQGNIVRMLPPLTLTDTEADILVDTVVDLIRD